MIVGAAEEMNARLVVMCTHTAAARPTDIVGSTALAVLQYRWIDQVSTAEHDRMRANIDFAARRFTSDLRAELGDLFETFARTECT